MDDAAKKAVVDTIAELLEDNYVYPETGEEMGRHIRQRIEAGAYDSFTLPASLASRLQGDLREISHDLHLRVRYDPETAAALLRGGGDDAELHRRRLERERRVNFGFERIERLAGNVGYLDIRFFADTSYARDTAAAAMAVLAGSDAVIFDLRSNGGGSPRMVQFLCSYFFGPEPVHLNSLYWRPSDRTDEFWTLKELPGERYPDTDLYVLTSRRTFSGAEEFTYNMKNLKRATIVGETTGGGAHPVNQKPVNDLFVITIPVGRAINPISKTNWEGVGVEPDVEVSRADALANAHLIALKKIHERTENEDWKRQLQGYIRQIERDLAAKK
jgi:C-terminal processing protease CtpA/Prc